MTISRTRSLNEQSDRHSSSLIILSQPLYSQALATLFDVREPEEFGVSHIENALNLGTAEQIAAVIVDTGAPIIVYCSVGYRSAGVAERLQEMGFTNVLNLQHSLFEWANHGYPMVNAMGRTTRVHPFNRPWGALVEESLHSY